MPSSLQNDSRVIDLIDWSSTSWKEVLVDSLFMQYDADCIKSIHLIDHTVQDELVWYCEKDGLFLVRSCYHRFMARRKEEKDVAEGSNSDKTARFWKKMWKAKIPPRIRDFMWRCAMGVLPCKTNLFKRKCIEDPFCGLCERVEMESHAIFECGYARRIWKLVPGVVKVGRDNASIVERIEVAFDSLES